ncbi:glycosyltransferase [Reyranella sp.]|jgi:hypothetical protein|uniref:glycosyltransferase n=1 Tax=Reyranella sp. TaxID=1929291 RepID=UPI002F939D55
MRVLEISRFGLLKALQPDDTHWIRWGGSLTADEPMRPEAPTLALLARTLKRIRGREFDLIVLPAIHPQHVHDQSRYKLMAKALLRRTARLPTVAALLHRHGLRATRSVVLDIHDDRRLCDTTLRLFPRCALYFKRELSLDEPNDGPMARKLKPIPLVLPDERRVPAAREKDIDLIFVGRICNETRAKAVDQARHLASRGIRVFIPDAPLSYPAFIEALSRSWLVLSPEGEGWDCYRHYEACLAGSVPLINRPRYRRHLYLGEGAHCFYYDADRDCLADQVVSLLADKPRLSQMAEDGRRHVLANHTRSAVGRYMLDELARSEH